MQVSGPAMAAAEERQRMGRKVGSDFANGIAGLMNRDFRGKERYAEQGNAERSDRIETSGTCSNPFLILF
jgi:hypothetical protein